MSPQSGLNEGECESYTGHSSVFLVGVGDVESCPVERMKNAVEYYVGLDAPYRALWPPCKITVSSPLL